MILSKIALGAGCLRTRWQREHKAYLTIILGDHQSYSHTECMHKVEYSIAHAFCSYVDDFMHERSASNFVNLKPRVCGL